MRGVRAWLHSSRGCRTTTRGDLFVARVEKLAGSDPTRLQAAFTRDPSLAECLQRLENAMLKDNTAKAEAVSHCPVGCEGANPSTQPATFPPLPSLGRYMMLSGVPFIGFGFFDNAIMLVAGDFFDSRLGALGISTLCAAALGNTLGDVCGIWLSGTVEAFTHRLGFTDPDLSRAQTQLRSVQLAKTVGCVFGVLIGCILGMFPLLWPTKWRLWDDTHVETSQQKDTGDSDQ